ncbi:MAG: DUF523 domain-containing protein [Humidesulfovibrio sp.]|uniref:DUF523 domain-containing protein n=1 Tax=Humidesulfovibrio sp. TaxID=2910988 RepID=UPI0027F02836|nr:DUF523 domain-containing protein [Humidesulfovibrio sp.]MDQ7835442.1 DUF523 domain-containing protein [Humidesulfovibrio sp.]
MPLVLNANEIILVSACLAGEACRYDGSSAPQQEILRLASLGRVIAVCPEVLGGLGTPRNPVELREGRAIDRSGDDVTGAFLAGAHKCLALAQEAGCRRAVLKARSPSCGAGMVYDGSFSSKLVPGDGMLAALLLSSGIEVLSEEDL